MVYPRRHVFPFFPKAQHSGIANPTVKRRSKINPIPNEAPYCLPLPLLPAGQISWQTYGLIKQIENARAMARRQITTLRIEIAVLPAIL